MTGHPRGVPAGVRQGARSFRRITDRRSAAGRAPTDSGITGTVTRCWYAQDLPANYFWESLGFVPIAFRGGSGKKKRVHIFWRRRIREGDTTTPWWFPAKTDQGAMREDRLVLPIPHGLHWSDPMPVLEPSSSGDTPKPRKRTRAAKVEVAPPPKPRGPVVFSAPPPDDAPEPSPAPPVKAETKPAKAERPKEKIDPQLAAKARELRDRYLEQVNERLLLASGGTYDVARTLVAPSPRLSLLAAG